jgi:hypothetical protein
MDLKEVEKECVLNSTNSQEDPAAGPCEHGNEYSGSIKDEN